MPRMRQALIRIWGHIESRLSAQNTRVVVANYRSIHSAGLKTDNHVCADVPSDKYERFVHPKVQSLLRELTELCPKTALPDYTSLEKTREITLLTKEQLKEAERKAREEALRITQMPPVLPGREECSEILSTDPGIEGFTSSSFVFIDTTLGLPERERNIMVRSPDGTLMSASWVTRDRISQIFYPRSGRRNKPASHLFGENFTRLVNNQKYKYLLDSACCQFEPDDPRFIQVTQKVYEQCDVNGDYEMLQSSRHFGPMVFSYILSKNILGIIKHYLRKRRWLDCIRIARIYSIVWDIKEIAPIADIVPDSERILYIKEFLACEKMLNEDLSHKLDVLVKKTLSHEIKNSMSAPLPEDGTSSSSSGSDSDSSSDEERENKEKS
ncbi:small ribosomal subunit protein mS22-like [Watersipora subatra]|uniref:small ribosomal subunit protein mS22-like n=1 Tax=Watersipora subatra TaxID=2589382 RepID=UPI00355C306A